MDSGCDDAPSEMALGGYISVDRGGRIKSEVLCRKRWECGPGGEMGNAAGGSGLRETWGTSDVRGIMTILGSAWNCVWGGNEVNCRVDKGVLSTT